MNRFGIRRPFNLAGFLGVEIGCFLEDVDGSEHIENLPDAELSEPLSLVPTSAVYAKIITAFAALDYTKSKQRDLSLLTPIVRSSSAWLVNLPR